MTRPQQLTDRPRPQVRRRTRHVLAAITAVLALVIGGTDVFLLTQGRASTPVELDSVLDDFRAADGTADETATDDGVTSDKAIATDTSEPTTQAPATDDEAAGGDVGEQATDPSNDPAPADTPAPATSDQPAPTTSEPANEQPATPTLQLPAQGVYEYDTDGQETVSLGGARHDYAETTFASIRHEGGCRYTVEHRWVEEHREKHHRCNQGTDMTQDFYTADITFFGQDEHSELRCDPPQLIMRLTDEPGTVRTSSCQGDDTTTSETTTYLGDVVLNIGGVEVVARHILNESTVEGRSRGTGRHEKWIHPDTGLTLKGIRDVDTVSQAFGSEVEYHEHVEYMLRSLTPRT